ncbi:MAG: hypothetical protein K8R35_10410 [Bacteroidales bacterium]|nr:hypothetical protein [Bacteroidales bacterium]
MKIQFKKHLTCFSILVISWFTGTGLIAQENSGQWTIITNWLVCGPFPSTGSMPEFYRDNLGSIGGEQGIEPVEGLTLSSKSYQTDNDQWYSKTSWQLHQAKEDGYVNFGKLYTTKTGELSGPWRKIAYAFVRLKVRKINVCSSKREPMMPFRCG